MSNPTPGCPDGGDRGLAVLPDSLCYGLLSRYLTIPVIKASSLLIFCFKIGSAVYLFGAALQAA